MPPQTFKTTTNKYLHISLLPKAFPQVHTNTTHFKVPLLQIKQVLLLGEQSMGLCSSQSKVFGPWIISPPLVDWVGLRTSLWKTFRSFPSQSGRGARIASRILGLSPPCLRPAHQKCFKSIPTVKPPFAPPSQMVEKLVSWIFLRKNASDLLVLSGQYLFTLDRLDVSHQVWEALGEGLLLRREVIFSEGTQMETLLWMK